MTDIEKVIKGLESCVKADWEVCMNKVCPYAPEKSYNFSCCRYKVMEDALELLKEQEHKDKMFHALEDDWKRLKELLKEQEDLGKELENAIELIHKKNARIEILNTVLNEQPQIVRCKDCKRKNTTACIIYCIGARSRDDWFCADGEAKE